MIYYKYGLIIATMTMMMMMMMMMMIMTMTTMMMMRIATIFRPCASLSPFVVDIDEGGRERERESTCLTSDEAAML